MFKFLKNLFTNRRDEDEMSRVLYITANPKSEEQSLSLTIGREFLNTYRSEKPNDEIIELDLYQTDIPYIDTDVFNGWGKLQQGKAFDELSDTEKMQVSKINSLTEQFISADKYVFVTPMWNFSFPPKMKAYIDTICIAGKTFKYTENGPSGLMDGKKAIHIQSRGGIYSEGPAMDMEFGDRYLKTIFNFLGITENESIIIEGTAQMPEETENIKQRAITHAKETAKNFAKDTVKI